MVCFVFWKVLYTIRTMDVLRHHRSLALLIFILVTYFSVSSAEHPHRHHHGSRQRRQNQDNRLYYVEDTSSPEYGNWGPWRAIGECSRSCGGGVITETRQCLRNGECSGPNKRYYSCNIHDCPYPDFDFRAYQCSLFNTVPFDDQYYTWVPYTKAPNKCELNCMPTNDRFYYRHKKQVIDGTPCDDEKPDICVDGKCVPVGCDRVLGSPAREDKCRICGGDGSSCITKRGIIEKTDLVVGYNDLLLIPSGATNLRIREVQPSYNYLAIRNLTGHYYLNGDWKIDYPKAMRFAGSIFHYKRLPVAFPGTESITALGPISESLYIVVLYQEKATEVEFEYSIRNDSVRVSDSVSYQWMYDEFSNCTASCGGGFRTRNVWCAERHDSTPVSTNLCDPALEPIKNQTCGTAPCLPDWEYSEWSECSQPCGNNGIQYRTALCKQVISIGISTIVDQHNCIAQRGNPENTTRPCNVGLPCPKWYIGPWKPCNKLCGDGVRRREVRCYYKIDGKISVTQDSSCVEKKPDVEVPCFIRPCEGVEWILSEWSGCEDKCDLTFETRRAICSTAKGKVYPNEFCKLSKLPKLIRNCSSMASFCEFQWYASQWSECSSKCGPGIKTRKVFCGTSGKDGIVIVEDVKCDSAKRYNTSENCTGTEICRGDWFAAPWSACSKKCGGGTKIRKVLCFLENTTVDVSNCAPDKIVFSSETCNDQPCGKDEIIPLSTTRTVSEESMEEYCEEYESNHVVTVSMLSNMNKHMNNNSTIKSTTEVHQDMMSNITIEDPKNISKRIRKRSVESKTEKVPLSTDNNIFSTSDSTYSSSINSTVYSSSTESYNISSSTEFYTEPSSDSFASNSQTVSGTDTTFHRLDTTSPVSITEVQTLPENYSSTSQNTTNTDAVSTFYTGQETSPSSFYSSNSENISSAGTTTHSSDSTSLGISTSGYVSSSQSITETSSLNSITTDSFLNTTSVASSTENISSTTVSTESTTESTLSISSSDTSLDISTNNSSSSSTTSQTSIYSSELNEITSTESGVLTTFILTSTSSSVSSTEVYLSTTSSSSSSYETETSNISDQTTSTEMTIKTRADIIKEEMTPKCKVKKKPKCETSEYGCCFDGISFATGPFSFGCPVVPTCNETKYGCCPDEVSPSQGPNFENCPLMSCNETLFGCCPDGKFAATGNDFEGCSVEPTTLSYNDCKTTEFGCCPDGITSASGPYFSGCYDCVEGSGDCSFCNQTLGCEKETSKMPCELEPFGCCNDNMTAAHGPNKEGCCLNTAYGCCPDNILAASGPNLEAYIGNPDNTTAAKGSKNERCGCEYTEFSYCPNKYTLATGPNFQGCSCYTYQFGCCPDGITTAEDPNYESCRCSDTEFGCCSDGKTPATNASRICGCEASRYGCCPDGITTAKGPNYEGCSCSDTEFGCCSDGKTPATNASRICGCEASRYGCCPDGVTTAKGSNYEGCSCSDTEFGCCSDGKTPATNASRICGCEASRYGCCPDGVTTAKGLNYEGCSCNDTEFGCCSDGKTPATNVSRICGCEASRYGCCPDGVTTAKGSNYEGCSCSDTEFGCCSDGKTPATNASRICGCEASRYGCCPDGINSALGENFEGCSKVLPKPGEICSAPKANGPCREFTVKWYFDVEYGGCSRFWYGGCEGNANRFKTQEECANICVNPSGKDACFLPQIKGPCDGYYPSWFYDSDLKRCRQFIYGGCLGNNNKFQTFEECEQLCVLPDKLEPCEQSVDSGPCEGNYTRWFFNKKDHSCQRFNYGGCKGNQNNFLTEMSCQQQCLQPGKTRPSEICSLPKDKGPCSGISVRWFYNSSDQVCQEFAYGGCLGNLNRFESKEKCIEHCLSPTNNDTKKEECLLPRTPGNCTERQRRWFFDPSENRCAPFYYTGCGGNKNNFESRDICEKFCPPAREQNLCTLPAVTGECPNYTERWYYNSLDNRCRQFYYGGCGGNSNNFLSEAACRYRCLSSSSEHVEPPAPVTTIAPYYPQSPHLSRSEICRLPSDHGPCSQDTQFWFYNANVGKCNVFSYGGCGGNQNRFASEEDCETTCSSLRINVEYTTIQQDTSCADAKETCTALRCPFGVTKHVNSNNCEICSCYNPCTEYVCQPGNQCAIEYYSDEQSQVSFRPVCRLLRKPGKCPAINGTQECTLECRTDADCGGESKCCVHSCGALCITPFVDVVTFTEPLTTEPYVPKIRESAPQIDQSVETDIVADEGHFATLRCIAYGYPKPTITWQKGLTSIDRSGSRYKLVDGILQIIGLHKSDSGVYSCTANNGVADAAIKEFRLTVKDGVNRSAEIIEDVVPSVVVTLGAPAILQCFAYGYPSPTVTWWKEEKLLNINSENYEQRRDHSLIIRRVSLRLLGPYTCQAYNGLGRAASWTTTLHAVGTVSATLTSDELAYTIYLIPPPVITPQTETPRTTPSTVHAVVITPKVYSVPVRTSINTNVTSYAHGSDVIIICDVSGYPPPQITWYKDDTPIVPNQKVTINENSQMRISNADANDAGVYKCSATNAYSSSTSSINVIIEGAYVPPNCTDSPFFANCSLIVQGQYCNHKYYQKFCCKSCALAGQLPLRSKRRSRSLHEGDTPEI